MITFFLAIMNIIAAVVSYLMFAFVSYKAYYWFVPYIMKDFYHLTYTNAIITMILLSFFVMPSISQIYMNVERFKNAMKHKDEYNNNYFIQSIVYYLVTPIISFILAYCMSWIFHWTIPLA